LLFIGKKLLLTLCFARNYLPVHYQISFVMKLEDLITIPQAKWLLNGTSAPRSHPCPGEKSIKPHDQVAMAHPCA
jgi:hypothetical protein